MRFTDLPKNSRIPKMLQNTVRENTIATRPEARYRSAQ
jgi:hypothetical protein